MTTPQSCCPSCYQVPTHENHKGGIYNGYCFNPSCPNCHQAGGKGYFGTTLTPTAPSQDSTPEGRINPPLPEVRCAVCQKIYLDGDSHICPPPEAGGKEEELELFCLKCGTNTPDGTWGALHNCPTPTPEGWEERFDQTFGRIISDKNDTLIRCSEGVKMFFRTELQKARKEGYDEAIKDIEREDEIRRNPNA